MADKIELNLEGSRLHVTPNIVLASAERRDILNNDGRTENVARMLAATFGVKSRRRGDEMARKAANLHVLNGDLAAAQGKFTFLRFGSTDIAEIGVVPPASREHPVMSYEIEPIEEPSFMKEGRATITSAIIPFRRADFHEEFGVADIFRDFSVGYRDEEIKLPLAETVIEDNSGITVVRAINSSLPVVLAVGEMDIADNLYRRDAENALNIPRPEMDDLRRGLAALALCALSADHRDDLLGSPFMPQTPPSDQPPDLYWK